eukprot:2185089-Pleurochrysis_carterae.AAC.2
MRRWLCIHRRRSVEAVADKRSPSRYRARLLRRRLGVCRWCRISSQTGRGRRQCRPGDGTVRRRARGRAAIGMRRRSHDPRCVHHAVRKPDQRQGGPAVQMAAPVGEESRQR